MPFSIRYSDILAQIEGIEPVRYGRSRNFIDGAVTRLSPYISRGVISTRQVMAHVFNMGHPFAKVEKFVQELAWRDYCHQSARHGVVPHIRLRLPQVCVDLRALRDPHLLPIIPLTVGRSV
ncbi:MAG: hypothetical protein AAF570_17150, partial [Bacteroidota bacterium]